MAWITVTLDLKDLATKAASFSAAKEEAEPSMATRILSNQPEPANFVHQRFKQTFVVYQVCSVYSQGVLACMTKLLSVNSTIADKISS